MKENMNQLLETINAIEELCKRRQGTIRNHKTRRNCTTPRIKLSTIQEAYTDSEGYEYPEMVDVKIENWSNSFFSYRLSDGKFVREGCNLSSNGISPFKLIKLMVTEYQEWIDHCLLHNEALDSNCVVFNGELVVCENVDNRFFALHIDGLQPVFDLVFQDGSTSGWYGCSPERALLNASPWLKETPVAIRLSHFSDRRGYKTSPSETNALLQGA